MVGRSMSRLVPRDSNKKVFDSPYPNLVMDELEPRSTSA